IRKVEVIAGAPTVRDFSLNPKTDELLPNYPDPFNPETWIPFRLSSDASVRISIYNQKGQLIRTINLGEKRAGSYIAKDKAAYWDGKNDIGERVSSGVYFYTLQAGGFKATRRMLIVK
ncbi:MAG: FlgD immunoglobulin-like domain containing protein, partial [Candidatus Poribacteria bacterium]